MESWRPIDTFPDYEVSDWGNVRNIRIRRLLAIYPNTHGIPMVGLSRQSERTYLRAPQHKRSIALLVANAFIEPPTLEKFNTPINMDGDRFNNHIDNLTLRPLWFARAYHQQFHKPPRGFNYPIEEVKTGEYFKTSWDAAIKYGLLDREILLATLNHTYVWPTFQTFRVVNGLRFDPCSYPSA